MSGTPQTLDPALEASQVPMQSTSALPVTQIMAGTLAPEQLIALLSSLPNFKLQGTAEDAAAQILQAQYAAASPSYLGQPSQVPVLQHIPLADQDQIDQLQSAPEASTSSPSPQRLKGTRDPNMSQEEWTRLRKDNHKEVERRRRGNINEGINELAALVPNSAGEKSKGAVLSRAVQYIHHLKDNEAHNIEKWTLEKLLMDQAMSDLQSQLEQTRRLWAEEVAVRGRVDIEARSLRQQVDDARRAMESQENEREMDSYADRDMIKVDDARKRSVEDDELDDRNTSKRHRAD